MKLSAGLCRWPDGEMYLSVYNFYHDIYAELPHELSHLERVTRFTYARGGKKGGGIGGGDTFLVGKKPIDLENISLTKEVIVRGGGYGIIDESIRQKIGDKFLRPGHLSNCMEKYDIIFDIVRGFPQKVIDRALSFGKVDIVWYCNGDATKKVREGERIKYVEKMIPKTRLQKIDYPYKGTKILDGGKPWFVPRCILEANIDLGGGCASAWIPREGASFDGEFFINYFWSPYSECAYCYSSDGHECPPKKVFKFDKRHEEQFVRELKGDARVHFDSDEKLGRPVKVLRFGKNVDPWIPGVTRDAFLRQLEILARRDVKAKGVITSKFLKYDKEVAKLVKRNGSHILISFGDNSAEQGACAQEYSNEEREEVLIKYHEAGANPIAYLMIHGHLPPTERDLRILELGRTQLLPIRYKQNKGKCLVKKMTGQTWDYLNENSKMNRGKRNQEGFLDDDGRASHVLYTGELVVKKFHLFWLKLIGNNNRRDVRMCHHNDELTYCGNCFVGKGDITKTIHVEKKGTNKWRRQGGRVKKKLDDKNLPLFEEL
ncbi:MAG: hypothetical protein ABIB79_02120 [archaeon]